MQTAKAWPGKIHRSVADAGKRPGRGGGEELLPTKSFLGVRLKKWPPPKLKVWIRHYRQ